MKEKTWVNELSAWLLNPQIRHALREEALDEINHLLKEAELNTLQFTFEEAVTLEEDQLTERLSEAVEALERFAQKTDTPVGRQILKCLSAIEEGNTGHLAFGTAGLRARMGSGLNRMNPHTLSIAAKALADHLKEVFSPEAIQTRPIVIGHDARHNARVFCKTVAAILANEGFTIHIASDYLPTPLLAYSIRSLNALCGLQITASHNTGEYNGMKLYAEDGIQSDEKMAASIAANMEQVILHGYEDADCEPFEKAGRVTLIPQDILDRYYQAVQEELKPIGGEADLKIAYTPVHGVGAKYILPLFESIGYTQVHVVEEEREPDPNFTGIPRPNPEYEETVAPLGQLAESCDCDIALATDPDADRFALMLPDGTGHFRMMTGNETAALLIDAYADYLNEQGLMPERPTLVKSIVSDFFAASIASLKGIEVCESLTGFKNICGKRRLFESDPEPKRDYIMGFEESIGFALGDAVRDKDGLRTACYMLRAALKQKKRGKTLFDRYHELSQEVKYHASYPIQIEREGLEGKAFIEGKMKAFRNDAMPEVLGRPLLRLEDYLTLEAKNYKPHGAQKQEATIEVIDEAKSNVLRYFYGEDIFFALRPSGTEPKIKLYLYTTAATEDEAKALVTQLAQLLQEKLNA